MIITLVDPITIRLTFAYNASTVAFIKGLQGASYESSSKCWFVPIYRLKTLITRFPTALIEDRPLVIEYRMQAWKRWIISYNAMNVWFGFCPSVEFWFQWMAERSMDDATHAREARRQGCEPVTFHYVPSYDTVMAEGPGVSPAFQVWVGRHSDVLCQFLGEQTEPVAVLSTTKCSSATNKMFPVAAPTDGERLIWLGVQNARKAEERKSEMVQRAKGKRRKVAAQMELEL